MNETKWTPGPYIVEFSPLEQNATIWARKTGGAVSGVVANLHLDWCHEDQRKERKATAFLMGAAPDLYAALEKMFQCVDSGVLVRNVEGDAQPDWALRMLSLVTTLKDCDAALAKARGEEPKP